MHDLLDIFYNDFIKEAAIGRVDCYTFYNVIFSTKILNNGIIEDLTVSDDDLYEDVLIPTLIIKDKKLFDELLIKYIELAKNFYKDDDFSEVDNIDKAIMARLFSNATIDDFNDPIAYLKRRIEFLETKPLEFDSELSLGYIPILDSNVVAELIKNPIFEETPYSLKLKLVNPNDSSQIYYLPLIRIGVYENKMYIYSIQNKDENDNQCVFVKRVKRKLYSADAGLDVKENTEENYGIGNLKDVSNSFLCALTILIGLLKNTEIIEVIAPSILIERMNAKKIFSSVYHEALVALGYTLEEANIKSEKIKTENLRLHQNLTDKFIRLFRRLAYHTDVLDIKSYPDDVDSFIHLSYYTENNYFNNELLRECYEIGTSINYENSKTIH